MIRGPRNAYVGTHLLPEQRSLLRKMANAQGKSLSLLLSELITEAMTLRENQRKQHER